MAELGPNPWSAWLQACVLEVLFLLEDKSDVGFAYSLESRCLVGGTAMCKGVLEAHWKGPSYILSPVLLGLHLGGKKSQPNFLLCRFWLVALF